MDPIRDELKALAGEREDIAALWLYGSRARGDHHPDSDYDLAVAFTDWIDAPLERRLRPELLAMEWQRALGLEEGRLSLVDMAICPIPLGWSILCEGLLLVDRHPEQRMTQESRIMSRWELDYWHRIPRSET
ncbi:type VII toxin-antitoxin system MntA family adenylyltransferase antitoxin [Halomonas ramblicola]|uniref:type VII toxin-antitoxin system MntA family adenylyltransferase antitoxin n=1 Tax=Halomonas ramblicola TaxID=747349 RepID=UPI0025B46AF6|nr:nucleotidyltransferase domain-containing protein [Halomonas ramblicola]MDN3520724.1 nucleotidyltransferase domain-containing protein [Halomonas ramblicola]